MQTCHYVTEMIHFSIGASIHIMNSNLESLDLVSLKEVKNGFVYTVSNSRLCYWPPAEQWGSILGDNSFYAGNNKNETKCCEYICVQNDHVLS